MHAKIPTIFQVVTKIYRGFFMLVLVYHISGISCKEPLKLFLLLQYQMDINNLGNQNKLV
jgi:hypothetical protein